MPRPAALLRKLDSLHQELKNLRASAGPRLGDNLSDDGRRLVQRWWAAHSALERYVYVMEGDDSLSSLFAQDDCEIERLQQSYLELSEIKIRTLR